MNAIKPHKIIFAAKDRGGFDALLPVLNRIKSGAKFKWTAILEGPAYEFAKKQKIKSLSATGISIFKIKEIIKKINPDIIFTGTSHGLSIDKKIIKIAKKEKIPTVSIVDHWGNYKQRFGEKLEYLPRYVLAIDERMKKEMTTDGISENRIIITGNPRFDRFSNIKRGKENKNIIVFYSQPFSEISDKNFNEVKIFEDIVKDLENIYPRKEIIVKFHPAEENHKKFDKIIKNTDLKIKIEENLQTYDLSKKAGLITGINSIALFDAALMQKKVLSYQPNLKGSDPLISNRVGLSVPVYQKKELYFALKKILSQKDQNKDLKLFKKYSQNNSTQKVIDSITDILKNNLKRKLRIIVCIQARMGSRRLKGKALLKISGKSLIENMLQRLKAAKEIDDIVLATSNSKENDILARHAEEIGLKYYRGKENDLISRYCQTAKKFKADALLLITGDCPLLDPDLVDRMARIYQRNYKKFDFFTNSFPPTFPHGLDMDIIPISTLERLDGEIKNPFYREYFAAYIIENPKKFRIYNLKNSVNLSSIRLTLDYPEDLILIRKISNALSKKNKIFATRDILKFLKENPQAQEINKNRMDMVIIRNIRSREYHSIINKNYE